MVSHLKGGGGKDLKEEWNLMGHTFTLLHYNKELNRTKEKEQKQPPKKSTHKIQGFYFAERKTTVCQKRQNFILFFFLLFIEITF